MEYMFINKPEFAEPIRVLFLCGSRFNDIDSDKRNVLKKYLEEDPKNKVILLEKYFNFALKHNNDNGLLSYYDANLFNLHNIESFAALVATNVIIVHETLSTAGEIGVFGSNKELRDRIITLVPEKFSVEEDKLSSFLKLAFWNYRDKLINNRVIRFYPIVKRTMVSDTHSFYETLFNKNAVPTTLENRIDQQLIKNPSSPAYAIGEKVNRYNRDCLTVWLSCASIKNYLMALLSVSEIRKEMRACTKIYEIHNVLNAAFLSAIKNAYRNVSGMVPKTVKIYIENQADLKFDDALSFMIYFWHACNIMSINCKEDGTISLRFSKNTSFLWSQYSKLIRPVSFSNWGE